MLVKGQPYSSEMAAQVETVFGGEMPSVTLEPEVAAGISGGMSSRTDLEDQGNTGLSLKEVLGGISTLLGEMKFTMSNLTQAIQGSSGIPGRSNR